MVVGDKASGMVDSIAEVFPEAAYQRCTVHFYRNVLAHVPKSRRLAVAAIPRAIHAMKSRGGAEAKALAVAEELERMWLAEAASVLREGFSETLTYTGLPCEHWHRIRTNNAIERLNSEIRRRPTWSALSRMGHRSPVLLPQCPSTSRRASDERALPGHGAA